MSFAIFYKKYSQKDLLNGFHDDFIFLTLKFLNYIATKARGKEILKYKVSSSSLRCLISFKDVHDFT